MGENENRQLVEWLFAQTRKGALEAAVEAYDDDVVIEYPQSGEMIEGKNDVLEVYRNFPEGPPSFELGRVRSVGDIVVAEHEGKYPDGSTWFATSVYEFRNGLVVHETDYFGPSFPAPEWRARWVTKLQRREP